MTGRSRHESKKLGCASSETKDRWVVWNRERQDETSSGCDEMSGLFDGTSGKLDGMAGKRSKTSGKQGRAEQTVDKTDQVYLRTGMNTK